MTGGAQGKIAGHRPPRRARRNHTRGNHFTCATCDGANTCDCQVTAPASCLETQCADTFCGPEVTETC